MQTIGGRVSDQLREKEKRCGDPHDEKKRGEIGKRRGGPYREN